MAHRRGEDEAARCRAEIVVAASSSRRPHRAMSASVVWLREALFDRQIVDSRAAGSSASATSYCAPTAMCSKSRRWRSARRPCWAARPRAAGGALRGATAPHPPPPRARGGRRRAAARRAARATRADGERDRRKTPLSATRTGGRARHPARRGIATPWPAWHAPAGATAAIRGRRDEASAHRGVSRGARAGHPRRSLRRRPRGHHDLLDPGRRPRLRIDLGARRRDGDAHPLPLHRRAARGGHRAGARWAHPRAPGRAGGGRADLASSWSRTWARRLRSSPASPLPSTSPESPG